jgi:hypothetical protein
MEIQLNMKKIGYAGSLIAQDFSEGGDAFHGYLFWDINEKTVEEIPVYNQYSFNDVYISQFTDFDDLDIDIDNATEYNKVRLVWNTLPNVKNKDNERKVIAHLKTKYNIISTTHKKNFIEENKIDIDNSVNLLNINDVSIQHKIFNDYLIKIGVDSQIINDIIKLDVEEIIPRIHVEEHTNFEWNIIKFGVENYRSYGKFDIDWRDQDGLFQIVGKNQIGKTSMINSLAYLLYSNTLETESQMKFGDLRYVNNRNDATYCSAYGVIESSGLFYGLKRKTSLKKDKNGNINGAPTTINYYLLNTPDDDMNDDNSIDKLDEETKKKTQNIINSVIGTYDNFMRVVMTTSDTLNKILSNIMAEFIDSLLFDSGLDIFDKKMSALKEYKKKVNEKPRISAFNIEALDNHILMQQEEIKSINDLNMVIEDYKIPDTKKSIAKGKEYLESLTKKLYKIDYDIYTLNVDDVKSKIKVREDNIIELNSQKYRLGKSISELVEVYDEIELNSLLLKKENHKSYEYNEKIKIKGCEQKIRDEEHNIEIVNGKIYNLKKDGSRLKEVVSNLKESKICPTCYQPLDTEHQKHINDTIIDHETKMFQIAREIKELENNELVVCNNKILQEKEYIINIETLISKETDSMISILKKIGEIQNQKNDVEKRNLLLLQLEQIPIKINNESLNIQLLNQKLDTYANNLLQIEDNKKIEIGINKSKLRLNELETELINHNNYLTTNKLKLADINNSIKIKQETIIEYKKQEKHDELIKLYESCVHRNGIPKQMLSNYIIPKINETLSNILSVSQFNVWLDETDFKPKLVFNDRPNSIVDCISSSGKERTFASIVIKFALNQINQKSKPTIFLLDEVMGKLDDTSVEEFIEILQLIKTHMKKVLIIEHKSEVNPDYIITVSQDDDGISSLSLE